MSAHRRTVVLDAAAGDALAERFRLAMRQVAATVTVVTTGTGAERCGITATAVTSLAMEPPSLLVCLHQKGTLRARLAEASAFCVNVLGSEQVHVSRAFAGGRPQSDRFAVGEWRDGPGAPYLQGAQCAVFCDTARTVDWATHTIIIGTVREVCLGRDPAPLVYCDGTFGQVRPDLDRDVRGPSCN